MTPVEEFYVRNHYPTPVAPEKQELVRETWKMRIHGDSVQNPMEITYNDLLKMFARTIIANMQCHGNGRNLFWEVQGYTGPQESGGSWVMGAIGLAEWRYQGSHGDLDAAAVDADGAAGSKKNPESASELSPEARRIADPSGRPAGHAGVCLGHAIRGARCRLSH
jgi:Oxidoreductase molybdopterin binding domain